MDIIVRKYGGSSLATAERVHRVAELVSEAGSTGQHVVVVVSARGDTTDELLALAEEFGGGRTSRETDALLATGENASAAQLAIALQRQGSPAVSLSGAQAGIRAGGKHGEGVISSITPDRIMRELNQGRIVVVAGFQAVDDNGDVITLGRGGSDTTAVALATVLGARRCEIYSDVDGVRSADPRVVPTARGLPRVDVGLMAEMAFAGAKVLHSRSVELAAMHGTEVYVGNSFAADAPDGSPAQQGTVIPGGADRAMLESQGVVVGVAHDADVARLLIQMAEGGSHDPAPEVLGLLAKGSVPVDLVARSGTHEDEFRMGCTIRRGDLAEVREVLAGWLKHNNATLRADERVGKLNLIGMGLLNRPEYTARLLATLGRAAIPTSWVSTSQLRTSVVVPLDRLEEAVRLVHDEFALSQEDAAAVSLTPA
jgi:aspartate kinase